jgi:cysteine desulfurase/selenocysteine lyase
VREGDEIIVSEMEHHSNIVPWQLLCGRKDATLRVIPMDDRGELDLAEYERMLGPKTRLVAVTHHSNALGTVNDVKRIVDLAHANRSRVLVDGAQAAAHRKIDVRDLGCDFYVISGHKICGPTGAGALYGKAEVLENLPPYQGGGDMIRSVTFAETKYKSIPGRFEAGTPAIAQVIGMGAAIDYLEGLPSAAAAHERELLAHASDAVSGIEGLRVIGTAREKEAILSFTLEQVHPHDIGTVMDTEGVCIRAGHHCAQPVMDHFGIPATARASFAFYNTKEEVDRLVAGIVKAIGMFS